MRGEMVQVNRDGEVMQQVWVMTWKISEWVMQWKRKRRCERCSEWYSSIWVSSVNLYSVRKYMSIWKGLWCRRWVWLHGDVAPVPIQSGLLWPTIISPLPTLKIVFARRATLKTHSPHSSDGLESHINHVKPTLYLVNDLIYFDLQGCLRC